MGDKITCVVCLLEITGAGYAEANKDDELVIVNKELNVVRLLRKGEVFCESCNANCDFYRRIR